LYQAVICVLSDTLMPVIAGGLCRSEASVYAH